MSDPDIAVDLTARTIVIPKPEYSRSEHAFVTRSFCIRIPQLFGEIDRVERRGDYLAVFTEHGKIAYYLTPGHNNVGLESRVGMMTWKNLRKAIRELCIDRRFVGRVDMLVNYYRNSGGNSQAWAHGRVTIDGTIVYQGNAVAFELGAALERYLHLSILEALNADDGVIRSFALLDRQTSDAQAAACAPNDCLHPLWAPFLELRHGPVSSSPAGLGASESASASSVSAGAGGPEGACLAQASASAGDSARRGGGGGARARQ